MEMLRNLEAAGCTQVNLFGFLYGFHRAQDLVFRTRRREKERVLNSLTGVVRGLTRTAVALEDVLKIPMSRQEQFGDWLRERLRLTLIQQGCEVAKIHFGPDWVLSLPHDLREHAEGINWLLSELRRELSARKVNESVYLAQLVSYVTEVTGKAAPWKTIADLIEISGIAAGSSRGQIEPELLRKNHASFKKRNSDLHAEINSDVKEYVFHCRQLPESDKAPTFFNWKRLRSSAH
jgi:hypothetical protein